MEKFRNFCMSDETEKVYHELEEVINAWYYHRFLNPFEKLEKVIELLSWYIRSHLFNLKGKY